jgi:hypothetical protein
VITAGRVMNGAASSGEKVERRVVSLEDDVLRRRAPDRLRARVCDRLELLQAAHLVDEPGGRLHLENVAELLGDAVERRRVEGEAHAPLGSELVDQQRVQRALDVLEEKRRAARLDGAVGDLRDLELRIDLGLDANELALALEERDPGAQVGRRSHGVQSRLERGERASGGGVAASAVSGRARSR